MEQGREVMADIISAKCFGCGHVVKVPSALGGKKARCPQCTNTIVIPTSGDSNAELISDDQLPEVARDDQAAQGEVIEENAEVLEAEPVNEDEPSRTFEGRRRTRTRSRGGTRVRKKQDTRKSGPRQPKVGYAPVRKKSSAGLIVGIVVALAAIGTVVAVVVSQGPGPPAPAPPGATDGQQAADQKNAEDHDLLVRCEQYTEAVNSQDPGRIKDFFRKGDNEQEVLRSVTRMVEQKTRYDNVTVKSASASSGQTTFTYSGGSGQAEKTLQWEKVGGKWMLTGAP